MELRNKLTVLCTSFLLLSCSNQKGTENSTNNEPGQISPDEWITLFDGSSTENWRGFNSTDMPDNWIIESGTLKAMGTGGDIGGDLVYGGREFDNFELTLEWRISEGGNSGIFYHVVEGEKYKAPYETGPEYQLLDNLGFSEPLEDWQTVGADYAMYPADYSENPVKAAGEWNTSRIVYSPEKCEYWLNGSKVVTFVPYSEEWTTRRNSGKWDQFPDYAKYKTGLISLQDHGNIAWFRNIKIREL